MFFSVSLFALCYVVTQALLFLLVFASLILRSYTSFAFSSCIHSAYVFTSFAFSSCIHSAYIIGSCRQTARRDTCQQLMIIHIVMVLLATYLQQANRFVSETNKTTSQYMLHFVFTPHLISGVMHALL